MLSFLFNASRTNKRLISITYDFIAIPVAIYLALVLRTGSALPIQPSYSILAVAITTILITLTVFIRLGLYRAVVRFMAEKAFFNIMIGLTFSVLTLASSSFLFQANIPRSTPVIYFFVAFALLGGPRLFLRSLINQLNNKAKKTVLIYGAGRQGVQLIKALQSSDEYRAVAFIDDNSKKKNTQIYSLRVHAKEDIEALLKQHKAEKVLLALGNASRQKRQQILNYLEPYPVEVLTTPSVQDIVSGKESIEQVKEVDIEDLLGRDPVKPDSELISKCIKNKSVLITGAGGSIGSELCRQALKQGPSKLILFELNEFSLYSIEQELNKEKELHDLDTIIISLLGSVQNQQRLESIFTTFKVNTVYHAAAYKHVPMVEHNVCEGVQNNVIGTWRCAEAAISANVEKFVLISTDKAVRPTNVMGASKRVAELTLQALAKRQETTLFSMVRFGNVLGSSGSVVPLFRKQINQGGPITVTHPDITRYFMTIPEASQLVIQAGAMAKGGDVFVLDMGESVKITELAQKMIRLSGLSEKKNGTTQGDIEIQFSGLRPGEKLYEELLIGDDVEGTAHSRIMTANEVHLTWPETHNLLNRLDKACSNFYVDKVIELLLEAPAAFNKQGEVPDWVRNT